MDLLRRTALIAVPVGALGSLACMFYVGRRQSSIILIILFTGWVLAPFAALFWTAMQAKTWPVVARAALHVAMLVITLGSLAIYGLIAFGPPVSKPAFAFLVVPVASWLPIAVVVAMGKMGNP